MSVKVETRMKKSEVNFTATFVGMSGFPSTVGAYTSSPVVELDEHLWSLRIYPGGYDEDSAGHLSCFIVYESKGHARAALKLSIVNQKGWKNHSYSSDTVKLFVNSVDSSDSMLWGDPKFVSKIDLRNPANGFCVDDKLVIKSELIMYGEVEQCTMSSNAASIGSPSKARSLCEEMCTLLYDDSISDLVIHAAGGETIVAHKFILCLRSEVFRAMLTGPMSESTSSEVRIPDFEAPVVRQFLHFLYTDSVSPAPGTMEQHAEALLAMACKYQVRGLETYCENFLCAALSLTNVIEVLSLADLFQAGRLKSRALQFIAHNAKAVVQSEAFSGLSLDLYPEVMRAVVGMQVGIAAGSVGGELAGDC
jgi:speckle-type POZ protein